MVAGCSTYVSIDESGILAKIGFVFIDFSFRFCISNV